ncbi:Gp25 [Yersinia rohdei ATCC 43380]|nr:Gp25 [Yersinia rohdei ATCC 43380]
MLMMLILGLFVFQLQTVPYQTLARSVDYRWPSNSRVVGDLTATPII